MSMMTVGALAAEAANDPCKQCPHGWHGMSCAMPVSEVIQGRIQHRECGCPSQWTPPDV